MGAGVLNKTKTDMQQTETVKNIPQHSTTVYQEDALQQLQETDYTPDTEKMPYSVPILSDSEHSFSHSNDESSDSDI